MIEIPFLYQIRPADDPATKVRKLEDQIRFISASGSKKKTVALYEKHVGSPSNRFMDDRIEEMTSEQQEAFVADMTALRDECYEIRMKERGDS